ncbi:MAG: large conductance mechanosensitive channel protein MscL [Armatimonadetes bacterium]|nr:large conductance mechanosensitive channel protein MscL [Armatimonadota bacterium]
MLRDFKAFVARGNVVDMAAGIVIGVAFGKIVSSFVDEIIMPPIGLLLGKVDFTNLFVVLAGGGPFATIADAKRAGAVTIGYGVFVNTIINFLIVAFAIFLMIRVINRWRSPDAITTKNCPFCKSNIAIDATRCPMCTSQLEKD